MKILMMMLLLGFSPLALAEQDLAVGGPPDQELNQNHRKPSSLGGQVPGPIPLETPERQEEVELESAPKGKLDKEKNEDTEARGGIIW